MTETRTILAVDIGNTAMKLSLFERERLVASAAGAVSSVADVGEAVGTMLTFNSVDGVAFCSVREACAEADYLRDEFEVPLVELTPATPLPIAVEYGSRATLGADRVAAAVGVNDPARTVLIVDAGTALTVDIVSGGRFLGGNISPGLALRFRSLARHTSRLPLVSPQGSLPAFGSDTETAIRSGVVGGLVAEIAGSYRAAAELYDNPRLILTGGDAAFLAPLLAERVGDVTVDPDAVGRGLVRIFNYNNEL